MSKRLFLNSKVMVTEDGGIAMSLINKTGTTSVKGTVAGAGPSVNDSFELLPVGRADPIGIVYGGDDGNQVADGVACWVVFGGKAYVLFQAATTRGHFARMTVTADADDAAGIAISEAFPTSPFATDKHFQEVGHVLEAIGGAGLALCAIHLN